MKARLILENGMIFEGNAFGHLKESVGEVVFTTGMTGYQEVLTDPSYYGQIVTMTYPLIGNYGINLEDSESKSPKVKGFIVRENCHFPNNFRCEMQLDDYLKQNKIIGLEGIDTRALTKILRNNGTMKGIISLESESLDEVKEKIEGFSNKEAVKYELIGYLTSSNITHEKNKIKFSTENEYNINRLSRLLSNIGINDYNILMQGNLFVITVDEKYLKEIDKTEELNLEQIKWIIRGTYLGSGSINNPEKKYHLEIGIRDKKEAGKIKDDLIKYNIKSNIIKKNNQYSIYIKDGEEISKFLALLGANKAVLKFEEIRVQREMNNKINRIVNCETANLNKTINASIEQIEAIKKLKENKIFDKMDEPLKEIAELRLKNPNASLVELGKMLKDPVGKSGVNYRLKKIMEIANEQ